MLGQVGPIFCVFSMPGFQGWSTIGKVGKMWNIVLCFYYARFSGLVHFRGCWARLDRNSVFIVCQVFRVCLLSGMLGQVGPIICVFSLQGFQG